MNMTPRAGPEKPASPPAPSHADAPDRLQAAAALLAATGATLVVVQALSPAARETGSGLVTYLVLAAAVEGACAIGFRLNRRWALAAYMSFFPLHQLILASVAIWSLFGFLLRMTVVILGFTRLSRLE